MKQFFFTILIAVTALQARAASIGDFERRLKLAETAGDRTLVAAICKEWYASGEYSYGLLNWNYNALMSVEQNALLFTQQESDTYPALMLQYALDVRTDVQVISFQLLEDQAYREVLIDREDLSWIAKEGSVHDFLSQLLNPKTAKAMLSKPVYFGSMTNKTLLQADKEKLYLTGLAFKFSAKPFDNVATLRYNFENRFRTDYLELNFALEKDPTTVTRVNLNYIPAMLLLHRHYSAAGETEKATRLQNLVLSLARAGDREAEVRAFFAPEPAMGPIVSSISPKSLEKTMKKVSENLFASDTETSNGQYEQFLTDLLKNKAFDQLERCKTTKTDWIALLDPALRTLPAKQIFKHGHPDAPEMPVQNISHDAAKGYCDWMTQVYNSSTEKKKYKKVLFRLPTEAEWMDAARGGHKDSPYPWPGGCYVQNTKGCYLGNYNTTKPCGDCPDQVLQGFSSSDSTALAATQVEQKPVDNAKFATLALGSLYDGGFFAVPVSSYYPNDFGLYAVSGNVAEMIDEAGKTKGGSWQDTIYFGQIQTHKVQNGPSPSVGFRVFMEVIER